MKIDRRASLTEALSTLRLAEVCNSTQKAIKAGLDQLDHDLCRLPVDPECDERGSVGRGPRGNGNTRNMP